MIIKNKGRLTVKKLKKQEQPMVDTITKKDETIIEKDKEIAKQMEEKEELETKIKAQQSENA